MHVQAAAVKNLVVQTNEILLRTPGADTRRSTIFFREIHSIFTEHARSLSAGTIMLMDMYNRIDAYHLLEDPDSPSVISMVGKARYIYGCWC